jgi:hypothetical protein
MLSVIYAECNLCLVPFILIVIFADCYKSLYILYYYAECRYTECHYAECRGAHYCQQLNSKAEGKLGS